MDAYHFENLNVWNESRQLVLLVYNYKRITLHLKSMVWETKSDEQLFLYPRILWKAMRDIR